MRHHKTLLLLTAMLFAGTASLTAQLEHKRLVLNLGLSLDRVKLSAERSVSPNIGLEAMLEYVIPFRDPANCDAVFGNSDWVDDRAGRTLKQLRFINHGVGARIGANYYLKQKESTSRNISFSTYLSYERSGYNDRFVDEDCATGDAVNTLAYRESSTYNYYGLQGYVNFHLTGVDDQWQPLFYVGVGAQYQTANRTVHSDVFNGSLEQSDAEVTASRFAPSVHLGFKIGYNLLWPNNAYSPYQLPAEATE